MLSRVMPLKLSSRTAFSTQSTAMFSIAVRLDLPEFLDELALGTGWRAERLSDHQLVLEPPGSLIECAGTRKRD